MQQTLATVNEDVRQQEKQVQTVRVLTTEVRRGASLVTASRTLQHEAMVDMKAKSKLHRTFTFWRVRRPYKWYIFSDALLICQRSSGRYPFRQRKLFMLRDVEVRGSNASTLRSTRKGSLEGEEEEARQRQGRPKREKPEVLVLTTVGHAERQYKCWAGSEEAMSAIVAKVEALSLDLQAAAAKKHAVALAAVAKRVDRTSHARPPSLVAVDMAGGAKPNLPLDGEPHSPVIKL